METKEIYCRVRGRVQMVMFRDFVQRKAKSLGLVGYVHNQGDGTVEVLAQGDAEDLKEFIAYLQKGSFLARVDGVEVEWRKPEKEYGSFEIVF